jgi:vancomycin resistance protein YoaR
MEPMVPPDISSLPTAIQTQAPRRVARDVVARRALAVALLALALGGSGTAAALYVSTVRGEGTIPGLRLLGQPIGEVPRGDLPARVHALAERFLAQPVRLRIGEGDVVKATLRDVGMTVDEGKVVAAALAAGRSGDPLVDMRTRLRARRRGLALAPVVQLDRGRALEYLSELKDEVDRSATDAHLDLERHTIAPERAGYLVRVFDSLVALEYAARSLSAPGSGEGVKEPREIVLSVAETKPTVKAADLGDVDVSTVLGTWETHYSSVGVDSDRAYNLKVGADKLNGHILKPGEVFSFNAVVGDRTEREGYRVAPVIQGGELVDGLAGGMCQIASTLHAASFFAGLEIVRSTPHSRPSTYIPMGLDATVVWPYVDLKLKNPYDFPVVLHYTVNQGTVKVEILGKKKPYNVAYDREIVNEVGFGTQVRHDATMPAGQRIIEQEGYPGYQIIRRRYVYTGKWKLGKDGEPEPEGLVSKKEWVMAYPSTTQIVRLGTGSPKLKKKEPPPSHRIPPVPAWARPHLFITK